MDICFLPRKKGSSGRGEGEDGEEKWREGER